MKAFLRAFILFGLKQASACVFGGFLLATMLLTKLYYPIESIHRYDFILLAAVGFQVFLLVTRLETPKEAIVILVFHALATVMELFKTHSSIGAWSYPEEFVLGIGNVPLFAGFMYSAVGSYISRIWRIFDFQFSRYPKRPLTWILVALIYVNFFSHHYVWDIRWGLLIASGVLFGRAWIYFKVESEHLRMPLLIGWLLVATFLWFAENIGTYCNIWIYPDQTGGWKPVGLDKLVAWFLLMKLSFVLVSLVHPPVVRRREGLATSQPVPESTVAV